MLASNIAQFGQCPLKKTCTEACYKSRKWLFFSRKVFRRGISDQLCHCISIEPNLTAFPHQPPSAFLHLYSSKEKQSCCCHYPIEKTAISFHYLVHTTFLDENIQRRKPNLVHDLWRPLDMQQSCCTRRLGQQNGFQMTSEVRTEPSCTRCKLFLTKLKGDQGYWFSVLKFCWTFLKNMFQELPSSKC